MKRHGIIGAVVAALVLSGGYLLYGRWQEGALASEDFSAWSPNANEILGRIGTLQKPAIGMDNAERRKQFCVLFKQRFRSHQPAIAVGIKFVSPTRIKLMCPARMEPWRMDSIAMLAWRESRAAFGSSCIVDIYETFIGTNSVKIGELHVLHDSPSVARIAYHYNMSYPYVVSNDRLSTEYVQPVHAVAKMHYLNPQNGWAGRKSTGPGAVQPSDAIPALHTTSRQVQP